MINALDVYAIYIVDTPGGMFTDDLLALVRFFTDGMFGLSLARRRG